MKPSASPLFVNIALASIATAVISTGAIIAATRPLPPAVDLPVPYLSQVLDGAWVSPWDEACEEATITMIQGYYNNQSAIDVNDARPHMQEFIDWEMKTFKKNNDTTAAETLRLINEMTDMRVSIKLDPTINDIKRELSKNRPVIAFLNMYKLYGEPNLGDSFHVLVITGYDEANLQFIVNDPARTAKRYDQTVFMNALHDFNPKSKEADGIPTVIFTAP